MMRHSLSRREMLALLGTGSAAGLASLTALVKIARGETPAPRSLLPAPITKWGLQLYTARSLLATDFDGTLKILGQIGYKEVESAGYYNRSPADFRKALDAAGLASPSCHLQGNTADALGANLQKTLDDCATIGHKWMVLASPPRGMSGADGYKQMGEMLSKGAAGAKSAGVRVAYHNHDADFRAIGDSNGMDILLSSSSDVYAELDVYWIVKAGGDPFAFIDKHPGRVKMLHLKDASAAPEQAMRSVGAGTIDWAHLLPKAEKAGIEHAFVEHDNPGDAIASVRASYDYLSHLKRAS
jgi:sugar phosphate isomerase/epimerase